jgi:cell division transport system permease protein
MRIPGLEISPADKRLLQEGRLAGPMPWVIAIMMFLTVLAAAGGLALAEAARGFSSKVGDRVTIQVIEADRDTRESQATAVVDLLRQTEGVRDVRRMGDEEMAKLLEPWFGAAGLAADLPVPALIDADLVTPARTLPTLQADLRRVAPSARIDDHAEWLAPVVALVNALKLLAAAIVLLMAAATGAAVVLAARGALNTHRATIEVLHLLGSTDVQIARLFQRRIALDALFGGAIGFLAASIVILIMANRIAGLGSELVGLLALPPASLLLLILLPLVGAALATIAARVTIVTALRKML